MPSEKEHFLKRKVHERISTELKIVLAGAGITFFGSVINRFLNYVLRIIIARGLSVEEYGLFNIAVIFMRAFVAFAALGLSEGIVRYVSYYRGLNEKEKIKGTLVSSFIITFLFSLIITIILFFSSDYIAINWFKSEELIPLLKIFILMIPIGVIISNLTSLNLAYEKIKYNFWLVDVSSQSLRVITIGFVILLGFGILGVGYAYLISFFIIFVLMFLIAEYKVYPLIRSKVKAKFETKELFSYSWPLVFVGILGYIMGWTDTFMIANLMDIRSVGLYNAALPLANLLTLLPLMFVPIFLPLITRNFAQKKTFLVDSLMKNVSKWSFIINFPVLILMLLFPGFFINLLFGKEYLEGTSALIFLSVGFFIFSLSYPSMQLLRMIKETKWYLINLVITIPTNVILNLFLIPKYGITGAAIATTISYSLHSLLFIGEGYYYLKLMPLSFKFWKAILAGLMALVLILILKNLVSGGFYIIILFCVLFSISYLILLLLLNTFDEQDKTLYHFLKSRLKKQKDI
ncbi:MAG: flippase [Nanoarchaeota archaeon]